MSDIKVGHIVGRASYNCDILFRVVNIDGDLVELHGEDMRIVADAPVSDLVAITEKDRKKRAKKLRQKEENCYQLFRQDRKLTRERNEYEITSGYTKRNTYFELPGKVLHLDGDSLYLKKCTQVYDRLGVPVYGVHLEEKEMPLQVKSLIEMIRPDILVITGHDAYSKSKGDEHEMKAYRNSRHFVDTVKEARKIVPYMDHLVIFAGACQSNFQSLLKAGANFASSPDRINIHALDPVYVVSKVSLTPFMERVGVWDVLKASLTGKQGLGGVETNGALRRGMPNYQDEEE
ncbi:sporulation peptidase YabG [Evansella cellulosilytica]|uniref:Sporulation peptidase YabG n=1 Tax=Evansella cellulosilytica (strain ATCC 21833 / DSM 2522 / FERM P-1141 / JCM 9156 / N-4) TaxID=649639 RepID=E6TRP1_EVAC2|nr:sporulation peptidase YabG [Evansella cellulosilytica]ADU28335.1 sporulation peptidase YabG [Evansella cellulosilytica DSM 2522]